MRETMDWINAATLYTNKEGKCESTIYTPNDISTCSCGEKQCIELAADLKDLTSIIQSSQ
jgi:hypothetical protein